jgi:uncharacterized protein YdeI (YjbR/CyaY-like superfamily)
MTNTVTVRPIRETQEKQAHHKIAGGTVHTMPEDFRKALLATPAARAVWDDITPLARNEWICWVISGKKEETRNIRIEKGISKLKGGMRRPCCWVGCIHR